MKKEYIFEGEVMGGTFAVTLISEEQEKARAMFEILHQEARRYERIFSRFMPDSELSLLNARKSMEVSHEMFTVLLLGKELYKRTGGACNMLVSARRLGYDRDIAEVRGAKRSTAFDDSYNIQVDTLELIEEARAVKLQPGQEVDVASFLKGYVAHKLADQARAFSGVIVNLSGDLFVRGVDEYNAPFVFEVENPQTGDVLCTFPLTQGAIATSGSYRRYWNIEGRRTHHILDERGKGNPTHNVASVTVVASQGYEADGFATAGFVLGSEAGREFLTTEGLSFLYVLEDGTIHTSLDSFAETVHI